ncbi:MAG: 30S ribosomal protein S4 [Planctomycetes bacterium]|nr:30S ribosomal protein S4 [Planctomycetota bacterium]
MSRLTGPQCKLCRREGMKLYLKGFRCHTVKCAFERNQYPPGMHHWRRGGPSEYASHLREKQKLKRFFGMNEGQFRRIFSMAEQMKGNTGENLLALTERRLDNAVYLLGWGLSRRDARQLVSHGHICVNGRKLDVPSYMVRKGDVVTLKKSEKTAGRLQVNLEASKDAEVPGWLEVQPEPLEGRVRSLPTADDASLLVEVQLVVELCSR